MDEKFHLDITVDENNFIGGATEIVKHIRPSWPIDQLQFKIFTNGITNKLVGVYYPEHYNEMILVRIYGNKTDLLIDRKDETRNIRILHKYGYTHSLYATFVNGLVYEFLTGEILTRETVRQPEVYWLVAKRMALMHKLKLHEFPDLDRRPMTWKMMDKFMALMPRNSNEGDAANRLDTPFESMIRPYDVLEREYQTLKEDLVQLNSPIVYAHNDLLLANVLYDKDANSVTFIDFEYTGFNYQAFDIANHFAEFAGVENIDYSLYPDESLQRAWLRIYLQAYHGSSNVSEDDVTILFKQIEHFVLMAHFLWGCWALIQYKHSTIEFDFLQFAATRFDEYFHRKQSLAIIPSDATTKL